ncbi:Protein TUNICAMYCIN INDUCED 1 [Cardamine amara subsp. amara]|uniref:Protein TUNICAMYCIN INDUCED 1 n=1 Tax=Cardamine amara subsp. amara TaxID=228776 RepID=A0ABD0ZZX6_CARAN
MLRSPFSVLLSLFLQALTLTIALDPSQTDDSNITATPILQDVLKEISVKQKWNLEEVRFSKLEVKKLRVGIGRSFEIRIRLGKSRFVFIFPDEVTDWRRIGGGREVELQEVVREVNSSKVLDPLVLKGPFELRVGGDDQLSLLLPMNISHSGLKRVLVSEGISVEIRDAQAVSLFHSSHRRYASTVDIKEPSCLWSFLGSVCVPLPPIQIIGSASLVAFRTSNADSQIKTAYLTDEAIQLLPEKCYYKTHTYSQHRFPTDLLGLRINKLEKVLSSLGNGNNRQTISSVTAKLKASGMLRFQLEIERRIGSNESVVTKTVEWRTKPKIERVWFEVTAKVEGDKLKAVGMRKMVPFIEVDTEAWSSLMSNMSFTKFPSILVPQEALTLDVKW